MKEMSDYAKRMRELSGFAENESKKQIKTIQEGEDKIYKLSINANSIEELVALAEDNESLDSFLRTELSSSEGVKTKEGHIFWGSDIFDFLKKEPRDSINGNNEFETHQFEQKEFESSESDNEIYNLNENSVIVLDFLKDDE